MLKHELQRDAVAKLKTKLPSMSHMFGVFRCQHYSAEIQLSSGS